MKVVDYLINNWINLALVVVGASAFITYLLQKRNEKKAAATKVLLQIDQIEKNVAALKANRKLYNTDVYRIPVILAYNSWEEYGFLFYKAIPQDDIKLIDDFFVCATELEKSRVAICRSLLVAWEHKDVELQKEIAEITRNGENIDVNIDNFKKSFNPRAEIFTADLPIDILLANLNNYRALSGTTAYKRLQKFSYRR